MCFHFFSVPMTILFRPLFQFQKRRVISALHIPTKKRKHRVEFCIRTRPFNYTFSNTSHTHPHLASIRGVMATWDSKISICIPLPLYQNPKSSISPTCLPPTALQGILLLYLTTTSTIYIPGTESIYI